LRVSSRETVFHRATGDGLFDGGVLIRRATDTLKSDQVKLRIDNQTNVLSTLRGDGNVHAILARGNGVASPAAGNTDLTAAHYIAQIGPGGEIQAVDIQGETAPAHATFSGPPQRELTAKTLRLAISGSQVTDVHAEGDAVLEELGAEPRRLQANKLNVLLDPGTHQPTSALLEQNLVYRDPKNRATGERAAYDVAGDHVILTAANGSAPTVISDGQSLKADRLEIAPKEGSLKGTGNVVARLISQKTAASASDTMMFPSGDAPVFVNSDSVILRQATRVGIFTGNVRAFQETNSLFANELQITGAGDMIQARGNVRTILYNSRPGASKTPTTAKGDQMVGKKADRRLDFEGHVQIVDETRTMNSEQASFFFDTRKKLERIEANRALTLVDKATGRKGNGDKAIYRTTQKLISLFGAPAVITDPKGSFQGKEILFDLAKNKVEVASGGTPTQGTYSPH
ncbi:MAG TPA: LptA/OstA family protein, partial [Thermoanaerobaculia bacterium]|nr:LptA/OstA family protein [Thermoanaerobaculia bacterium]